VYIYFVSALVYSNLFLGTMSVMIYIIDWSFVFIGMQFSIVSTEHKLFIGFKLNGNLSGFQVRTFFLVLENYCEHYTTYHLKLSYVSLGINFWGIGYVFTQTWPKHFSELTIRYKLDL
jgi:hypothetical protein